MKLKNQINQQVLDRTTGEIVEVTTQKTYSIKMDSDKFFMTFIETVAPIYKLRSLSDLKLMIKFCTITQFNTGKIIISPALRKEICEELNISTNMFSISLRSLLDKQLIYGEKGSYIINPQLHWKGTIDSRNQLMKTLRITFTISNESD
jgi:hypothetical protein